MNPRASTTSPSSPLRGAAATLFVAVSATLVAVASAAPLVAQLRVETARLGAGASFESYTFSEPDAVGLDGVTLFSLPFAARAPLGRRLSLDVSGAWASGTVTRPDGSESTLSGPTDTQVGLSVHVIPDVLTLTGVFAAPTGTATHDADEALVAGVIAADLLPFRVGHWGAGGGIGMQMMATRRFEGLGAGLSVGYRRAGEFEPVAGDPLVYQPGNEMRVRLALDGEMGRNGKGSLVVGFQRYDDDTVDGANLFQSGNRVEATGTYAFPAGSAGSAAIYGSVLHRASGEFLDPGFDIPAASQDLVMAGGLLRRAFVGGWITPRADVRLFRSEDGVGQGYVGTLGLSAEMGGSGVTWVPTLRGRYGNVEVREGASSALTGFEAGLAIRFGR